MSNPLVTCPLCAAQTAKGRFCSSCGKSLQPSPTAKRDRRLIMIPLAIGCAFFAIAGAGILAAIIIPNFTDALQKAKQKRTVADLRLYGDAWQTWAADQGIEVVDLDEDAELYDFDEMEPLAWEEFESRLVPDYLTEMRFTDAWEHPYEVYADLEDGRLALRSPGRDGISDDNLVIVGGFTPSDYDQDIVWAEGVFLSWPEP